MRKILSIFLIIISLILISNSVVINITGYIINENFTFGGSVLGFIFLIGGLALFLSSQKSEGGLEKEIKITKSKKFIKSIKNHPKEEIDRVLKKIGTGLADEKYLKYRNAWSLRVSKGARILYEKTPDEIILIAYEPSSKHI